MKMPLQKIPVAFSAALVVLSALGAQAQDSKARVETLNLIRKEKFDKVLPRAMRDSEVDMWIHVIRRGAPDAYALDFGTTMGYVVFTDRGGDRIERALFGNRFAEIADETVYDIIGDEADLTKHVAERDPKRIAVNMSETLSQADGLSYTGYRKLERLLGEKYARRLISSEGVITDFRVRRVQSEIIAFARACEIQRRIMEAGLASIKPGQTTREEVGWWANDQLLAQGIEPSYFEPDLPEVQHSAVSPEAETERPGYAFQRGDLISWDWGIHYLNFGTDFKRKAYLLRPGETALPPSIQKAWDRGLQAREIIRRTLTSGRTAGEALKVVVATLQKAGFAYTPFVDTPQDEQIIQAMKDSDQSGFSVDCHCVGNTGNSEVAEGPSMAPFRPSRAQLIIQPNNLISFEFIVHTWIPEWKKRLAINFEDNALVTERGVEALYPRNDQIILVR